MKYIFLFLFITGSVFGQDGSLPIELSPEEKIDIEKQYINCMGNVKGDQERANFCKNQVTNSCADESCGAPDKVKAFANSLYQTSISDIVNDVVTDYTNNFNSLGQYCSGLVEDQDNIPVAQDYINLAIPAFGVNTQDLELSEVTISNVLTLASCGQIHTSKSHNNFFGTVAEIMKDDNSRTNLCKAHAKLNCKTNDANEYRSCFSQFNVKKFNTLISPCLTMNSIMIKAQEANGDEENTQTVANVPTGPMGMGEVLICKKTSGITLDYKSCKKATYHFNAGFVSDLAGGMAIEAYGTIKQVGIQQDQMQNMGAGGLQAQTAAMEAQKKAHQLNAQKETAKMALEGAKGTSMLYMMANYITEKKVTRSWCNNGVEDESNNAYGVTSSEACMAMALYHQDNSEQLFKNHTIKGLFQNRHMIQKLTMVGAQSMSKALIAGLVASLQRKQAKMVGQVKDAFEKSMTPQGNGSEISLPGFCEANPQAPSCQNGSGPRRSVGGGLDMNFGSMGNSPNELNVSDTADIDEGSAGSDEVASSSSGDDFSDLSEIMAPGNDNGGTNDIKDKIAAGQISNNQRQGGGGGGGSGGGGGGAASSGGGEGKRKAKAPGRMKRGKTSGKYVAGTSGKFAQGRNGKGGKKSGKSKMLYQIF